MSEKKYVSARETADFEQAQVYDKLRVGSEGVYFREGLRTRFIPYSDMDRAFIRIHEVNGRMCCGSAVFHYFRMVFAKDGKEFADMVSEKEKAMDEALAAIAAKAPGVAIGVA
ncbi:MAG: hypothetical protein IJ594_02500 [Oscillospiraceae bacterium]|nr:hypothetical protein [Oscillospiraceae bacterium]